MRRRKRRSGSRSSSNLRRTLLLSLLLCGCPEQPTKPKPAEKDVTSSRKVPERKNNKLLILAAGDVGSDTEACGCKAKPMGGIARRTAVIREKSEAFKGSTLILDAGDLFFRNWSISPRYEKEARATARFHADWLKKMKVPAMAVGERDLALGLETLRALAKRSGTKLLSANLVHTKSGTTAFAPFIVVERDGMRIGLVGASLEMGKKAQAYQAYKRAGLVALPFGPLVEKAAQDARKEGAVLVVGLLHTGHARARQVLTALPLGTIDLAIVAHDRMQGKLRIVNNGRSAYAMPGSRGKVLVAVEVELSPGGRGVVDPSGWEKQREAIRALDERISTYRTLDAGIKDETVAAKVAADHYATMKRMERRKKKLELELSDRVAEKRHVVTGELIKLHLAVAEDRSTKAAFSAFLNTIKPKVNRAELRFLGNKACAKECHKEELRQWRRTGHAKAWATLVRTKQTGNLDCIPCHVVGFDRRGGPSRLAGLKRFHDVGCESCHGPGSAHAKDPEKIEMDYGKKGVPERVCRECHRQQKQQKPFNYEDRLPKVLGRGHGK